MYDPYLNQIGTFLQRSCKWRPTLGIIRQIFFLFNRQGWGGALGTRVGFHVSCYWEYFLRIFFLFWMGAHPPPWLRVGWPFKFLKNTSSPKARSSQLKLKFQVVKRNPVIPSTGKVSTTFPTMSYYPSDGLFDTGRRRRYCRLKRWSLQMANTWNWWHFRATFDKHLELTSWRRFVYNCVTDDRCPHGRNYYDCHRIRRSLDEMVKSRLPWTAAVEVRNWWSGTCHREPMSRCFPCLPSTLADTDRVRCIWLSCDVVAAFLRLDDGTIPYPCTGWEPICGDHSAGRSVLPNRPVV